MVFYISQGPRGFKRYTDATQCCIPSFQKSTDAAQWCTSGFGGPTPARQLWKTMTTRPMQNEHRLHFCMVFWARCSFLHGPGGHRFHNSRVTVGPPKPGVHHCAATVDLLQLGVHYCIAAVVLCAHVAICGDLWWYVTTCADMWWYVTICICIDDGYRWQV